MNVRIDHNSLRLKVEEMLSYFQEQSPEDHLGYLAATYVIGGMIRESPQHQLLVITDIEKLDDLVDLLLEKGIYVGPGSEYVN